MNNKLILIAATAFALTLTACGTGHDHGPTPVGLNLVIDGQVVASQEGTTITYPSGNDSIQIISGETSGTFEVQWFLESGEIYNYSTEDGYSLNVNVTDESVLDYNHPVGGNQWQMQLIGLSEGTSGFTLELFHVSHSDFGSRVFNVQVIEPVVN